LRFALKGINHPNVPVPQWVATLEMAQEWSIPPWTVEEQANQYWVERFMCYRSEQAKESKRKREEAERRHGRR